MNLEQYRLLLVQFLHTRGESPDDAEDLAAEANWARAREKLRAFLSEYAA